VLETTVARLRRRLAKSGLPVRTINGRGYLLDAAVVPCPRRCVDRHTVPLTSFGA
jgi:DNA-binding winged helix-turn-helix (wHTH) protein